MKTKNVTMQCTQNLLLVLVLAGMTAACSEKTPEAKTGDSSATENTSITDVKQEAQDLTQALKSYGIDQRDEAIKATELALERLDQRIAEFEARVKENTAELSETARKEARRNLDMLREQRAEVAASYAELETNSDDAWDHIKDGFSDAYASIITALEKAEREFESGA